MDMYAAPRYEPENKQPNLYLDKDILILPAWIQGRVSTKAQVSSDKVVNGEIVSEDKASLEIQEKRCRDAIQSFRGNCPKCYRELRLSFAGMSLGQGVSGRSLEREDMQGILQAAKDGLVKVVVTIDYDRLARDKDIASTIRSQLKKRGVQVYSLAQQTSIKCPEHFDPLDDDSTVITETISDMKAQLDLSKIRRNYKIGMPKRIQRGEPSGSLAYGLIKKYEKAGVDSRGNEVVEVIYCWSKDKVRIVNRIVREYLSGMGVWKICQGLNSEGISSPQGKVWGRSAVLHILKNPAYAGRVRFGWKPVKNGERKIQPMDKWMIEKARYKGLWSWAFYEEIQREVARRVTIGGRAVSSGGLLIGMLKCAHCKYSMYQGRGAKILKNGEKYQWKGYVCGTYMHRGACVHNGIKQKNLDEIVLKEVLKLADEETRKTFINQLKQDRESGFQGQLEVKKKSLSQLLSQFDRVNTAYREGIDTLEEYAKKKSDLIPQIESLKIFIKMLESKVEKVGELDWNEEYKKVLSDFLKYPTRETKQKVRNILSKLIDKVEFRRKPFAVKIIYKTS